MSPEIFPEQQQAKFKLSEWTVTLYYYTILLKYCNGWQRWSHWVIAIQMYWDKVMRIRTLINKVYSPNGCWLAYATKPTLEPRCKAHASFILFILLQFRDASGGSIFCVQMGRDHARASCLICRYYASSQPLHRSFSRKHLGVSCQACRVHYAS